MELTLSTLQQLTSLQVRINTLTAEIDKIKSLMAQLANDDCGFIVTFRFTNNTQKKEVESEQHFEGGYYHKPLWYDLLNERLFQRGGVMVGEGKREFKPRYEEEVSHRFDEAGSMRLLNLMLQMKRQQREALMLEAQSILQSQTI